MGLTAIHSAEAVYEELWHVSAGPCVSVPRVGERVYYFPQGHLEQLQASMNQGLNQQLPSFNLPDKILCKVMNIHLRAEADTDEIYAQITLFPDHNQSEVPIPDSPNPEPHSCFMSSFCKQLTSSDTNTNDGLFLHSKHAVDFFPPLDVSQYSPYQEVVAIDIHGNQWRFLHVFQGQPRGHMLTTGWSTFVRAKKLVAGDTVFFLKGGNGELYVGIRRLMSHLNNLPSSVTSSSQSQLGMLAAASHACSTGTIFSVIYKPRASRVPFMISLNKYLESQNYEFFVGMMAKMRIEGEEGFEKRVSGTIIGVGETNSLKWPNSEWRSIKVRWEKSISKSLPDSVSPWELEPPTESECNCFCLGTLKKLFCGE